jgi:BioD-like phosphotransacetylase family protein
MTRNILITATRQNEGKTAITLGLTAAFSRRLKHIGFIKPLGLGDVDLVRARVDEDTLLVERACRIHCNIEDMSPVTLRGGFPDDMVTEKGRTELMDRVRRAHERVADGKELVVIEGTGHAAVGSVFGLANAAIARTFGAKVLLVSSGGVGHPIDEVLLNKRFFEHEGVELLGVVLNKVFPAERERIDRVTRRILEENGVRLLGVLPFDESLNRPRIMQVLEAVRGDVLAGETKLHHSVGQVLLGAMTPHNAIDHFKGEILLVTPGDRDDLLLAVTGLHHIPGRRAFTLSGIVLTGGLYPDKALLDLLKTLDIPVIVTQLDSFMAASAINNIVVKISPWDKEKIQYIVDFVGQHLDADEILKLA